MTSTAIESESQSALQPGRANIKEHDISQHMKLKRFLKGWQHDPVIMDAYFEVVERNWKEYQGDKPRNLQPKVKAILLQIHRGDYVNESSMSADHALQDASPAFQIWKLLAGTTSEDAKRRFINLLKQIDPKLMEMKVIPAGVHQLTTDVGHLIALTIACAALQAGYRLTTRDGRQICPWCNTARGCPLALQTAGGKSISELLDRKFSAFRKGSNFVRWLSEQDSHGCDLGIHEPVSSLIAAPYLAWYRQKICGGFVPYDNSPFYDLIKYHVVDRQARRFRDMFDTNSRHYQRAEVEDELNIALELKKVYETYTKRSYTYEIPCTRHVHQCEHRRVVEGGKNHMHPFPLDLEHGIFCATAYDDVIEAREECRTLGLSCKTGIVRDPGRRLRIFKERIATYRTRVAIGRDLSAKYEDAQSRHTNDVNTNIPARALRTFNKNLKNAIVQEKPDTIRRSLQLGAVPDLETGCGLTALIRSVLLGDITLTRDLVLESHCAVDHVNHCGMTALGYACIKGQDAIIETLLDLGANPSLESPVSHRTPFLLAVEHNQTQAIDVILDNFKGADKLLNQRTARDHGDLGGGNLTALMLAGVQRNWGLLRQLLSRNADRLLKNAEGETAEQMIQQAGWKVLANWLRTSKAQGPTSMYSASDQEAEREIQEKTTLFREYIRRYGVQLADTRQRLHSRDSNSSISRAASRESSREQLQFPSPGMTFIIRTADDNTKDASIPRGQHQQGTRARSSSTTLPKDLADRDDLEEDRGGHTATLPVSSSSPRGYPAQSTNNPNHSSLSESNNNPSAYSPTSSGGPSKPSTPSQSTRRPTRAPQFHATHDRPDLRAPIIEKKVHPLIDLLRSNLVPPNLETDEGSTALICAAHAGDVDLLRSFLEEGASVDYSNKLGKTALLAAASAGQFTTALELLDRGADIRHEDFEGRSCLFYAHQGGHDKLVIFLKHVHKEGLKRALVRQQIISEQGKVKEVIDRQQQLLERYGLDTQHKMEKEGAGAYAARRMAKADRIFRCWKCTLYVPCQHFANWTELRASMPEGSRVAGAWKWRQQPKGWLKRVKIRRKEEEERRRREEAMDWQEVEEVWMEQRSSDVERAAGSMKSHLTSEAGSGRPVESQRERSSADKVASSASKEEEEDTPRPWQGEEAETGLKDESAHSAMDNNHIASAMPNPDYEATNALIATTGSTEPPTVNPSQSFAAFASKSLTSKKGHFPPLRILYPNVRSQLSPRPSPRPQHPFPAPGQRSGILDRLTQPTHSLSNLFTHPSTWTDLTIIHSKDQILLRLRCTQNPTNLPPLITSGTGFLSIDLRQGLVLYPICPRCHLGIAKLTSKALGHPVCDICLLTDTDTPDPGPLLPLAPSRNHGYALRNDLAAQRQADVSLLATFGQLASTQGILVSTVGSDHAAFPDGPLPPPVLSSSRRDPSSSKTFDALATTLWSHRKAHAANTGVRPTSAGDVPETGQGTELPQGSKGNKGHHGKRNVPLRPILKGEADQEVQRVDFMLTMAGQVLPQVKQKMQEEAAALAAAGENREDIKREQRHQRWALDRERADLAEQQRTAHMSLSPSRTTMLKRPLGAINKIPVDSRRSLDRALYDAEGLGLIWTPEPILDLAQQCLSQSRVSEAEGILLRALGEFVEEYGAWHVAIALCLRSLGEVEEVKGCWGLSRAYRELSWEIWVLLLGPVYKESLLSLSLLGRSLLGQGLQGEVGRLYRSVAEDLKGWKVREYREIAEYLEEEAERVEVGGEQRRLSKVDGAMEEVRRRKSLGSGGKTEAEEDVTETRTSLGASPPRLVQEWEAEAREAGIEGGSGAYSGGQI